MRGIRKHRYFNLSNSGNISNMRRLFLKINHFTQTHKVLILISFLIVEFILVLSLVHKRYFSVILFYLAIIGLTYISRKLKKEKNKSKKGTLLIQLMLNLKGEAGSWVGILTVISLVINLNIISNLIWETQGTFESFSIKGLFLHLNNFNIDFWMLNSWGIFITQILLIVFFLIIPFDLFPVIGIKNDPNPLILISGLSILTDGGKDVKNKELVRKKLMSIDPANKKTKKFYNTEPKVIEPKAFELFKLDGKEINWGKWNVIRHSLEAHKSIEKIILISSKEIHELNNTIDDLIKEDIYFSNFKLENLVKKFYPAQTIEIVYSNPMEFNDFYDVKSKLQSVLSEQALGKGFSDTDLLFNITGGTAQVTAAMILSSLKGDRKAEYINQNTHEIVNVDVDVLTIQDLWDEIGLRVMKSKL